MKRTGFSLLAGSCLLASAAQAAVKLPNVFNHDMVLQRGQPVPVWGWADPGENVTVEFAGQKKSAAAGADGAWRVALDALTASSEPAAFKVSGANTVTFTNVVVGEVWLCSGQSNMEWPMRNINNAEQECAAADYPLIRHFKAPKSVKPAPEKDINAKWEVTTPQGISDESAVAFFFGRRLHQALKVPVGLLNCSWGGTRIEPWTPACGFEGLPQLEAIKTRVDTAMPGTPLHDKVLNDYVAAMQAWLAAAQAGNAAGRPVAAPAPDFPQNLILASAQGANQQPTVLFNGMVAGLVPFAIKGAIWYQGCSNNGEGMLYLEKTKALVNGWRKVWGQGDFPYYLVQLAPYNYGGPRASHLPALWEAQAAVPAAIPNTGCTVINDVGNPRDIHPRDKQTVGLRLANQALDRTYRLTGEDVRWEGPLYKSFAVEGPKLRVTFDFADGLKTRDGKPPSWFELSGIDGVFHPADAAIEGATVLLSAPAVTDPVAMRFAWNQTAEPNLVNGRGLPAGAFRCSRAPKLDSALALPELQGFRKVYEIDLPASAAFKSAPPKYALDASASAGSFTRVAYLLQLQQAGAVRYVATVMDAFTQDAKLLGIPFHGSGIKHQQKVAALTVRSNVEGLPLLTASDGGSIEFWSVNYSPHTSLGLPGASAQKYDFDDRPSAEGSHGCMQVHSWKDKTVLWAYNNFNGGGGDIGIGNAPGEHPDYTFSNNAGQYEARRLTVLVK